MNFFWYKQVEQSFRVSRVTPTHYESDFDGVEISDSVIYNQLADCMISWKH